ncbi:MAG TPA: T9SS type A sorting domain-containing protein [Flavobacteriaceae bacterium]|nr:T9SS type A sorting domain-containing protein [Flavobacteriaceae bacterium]
MYAYTNPSLTCIQVDDVDEANMKPSWYKDDGIADYMLSCPGLSTNKFDFSSFLIYPNPTKDIFEIDLNIVVDYKLHNILGQEVLSGTFAQGLNKLDVSSISSGLYILNLNSEIGSISKKLVKN